MATNEINKLALYFYLSKSKTDEITMIMTLYYEHFLIRCPCVILVGRTLTC